jgi:zeaxanthin glucosyltransferase
VSHFGVVAPPLYSHFQALQAVAGELLERGHRVTFFQQVDAHRWLDDPRMGFCAVGRATHPAGSLASLLARAAAPSGLGGLRRLIDDLARGTAMLCAELPEALRREGIDALLCDQMEAAGGLIAEGLGLPFVSVACALPINREPGLPLPVMPFAYGTRPFDLQLYQGSQRVHDWLMQPLRDVLHTACRQLRLPPRDGLQDCLSQAAQVSQTVVGFDFPRAQPPANFYSVGPLRATRAAAEAPLPWPVEAARPFIFASLGTLQGARLDMFIQVAKACRRLNAQLLVAHCGGLAAGDVARLMAAGATWVTDFAPQRAVLARADILVTHGGLNTVLDAIAAGTPMLVLPIAFDQPGVAARVVHSGIGLRLGRRARAGSIAAALGRLAAWPGEPLRRLSAELAEAGGARRAALIAEQVMAGVPIGLQESAHAP